MADQTLFDRPNLATPPADNDRTWVTDVSDVTDGVNGTDKRQNISVLRTQGNGQYLTMDNAGTIGPNGGEIHINLALASFFRVRSNAAANLLTVANSGAVTVQNNLSIATGDININAGDLIVQAGDVTIGTLSLSSSPNIISSTGNLTINTTTNFTLDSVNTTINGTTSVFLNGGSGTLSVFADVGIIGVDLNLNNNDIINIGNLTANQLNQSGNSTPPANASDTGTTGEIRIDGNYIYYCSALNTWVRTALATW